MVHQRGQRGNVRSKVDVNWLRDPLTTLHHTAQNRIILPAALSPWSVEGVCRCIAVENKRKTREKRTPLQVPHLCTARYFCHKCTRLPHRALDSPALHPRTLHRPSVFPHSSPARAHVTSIARHHTPTGAPAASDMHAAASTSALPPDTPGPASGGAAAPSRRSVVHYRSSNLEATNPTLALSVDARDTARVPAIVKANALAETVREQFKKRSRAQRQQRLADPASSEEAEKAGRYDRRLKMNRQSAAASRVRREAYIKALESVLVEEDNKHRALMAELEAERAAHRKLRDGMSVVPPDPPVVVVTQPALVAPPTLSTSPPDVMDWLSIVGDPSLISPQTDQLPLADFAADPNAATASFPVLDELVFSQQQPFVYPATDPVDPQEAIDTLLNI